MCYLASPICSDFAANLDLHLKKKHESHWVAGQIVRKCVETGRKKDEVLQVSCTLTDDYSSWAGYAVE